MILAPRGSTFLATGLTAGFLATGLRAGGLRTGGLRTGGFRAPGLATTLFGAKSAESAARPESPSEAGLAPAFFTTRFTTFLATGLRAPATRAGTFFTTVCFLTNAFFGDAVLPPLNMTGTGEAATAGRCTRSWVNAGVHAHAVASQASSTNMLFARMPTL